MALASGLQMYHATQAKDEQSQLVERYAPLVKRIAYHMLARLPASVQVEDLIQSGMIGLLEAARNFDASKGASFETFAGIRIRGSMLDEVRKGDWAPRSVHRNSRLVSAAVSAVESRTGRDASDREIADELEVSLETYHQMLSDTRGSRLFSYDGLMEDGAPEPASQALYEPGGQIEDERFKQALARAIEGLPERERLLLSLYYNEGLNLKEIGAVLGVSESRVSQLNSQAAARLRARLADWQDSP